MLKGETIDINCLTEFAFFDEDIVEYTVIRNKRRKKLLMTVKVTGEVVVKAGIFTREKVIEKFVKDNLEWIETQQADYRKKYHCIKLVTKQEREEMKKSALPVMKELTDRYSNIMGLKPSGVKITTAEKRWGSCSGKDRICFSYRVLPLSQKCKEYLVIHELCHLKEFNHSKEFYSLVEKYMPDYKQAEKELSGYYIHCEE